MGNVVDDFEKQIKSKKYLDTPFGKIETVIIIPQKVTNPLPVLLASGWHETLELQEECLREIYQSGRIVMALRHVEHIQNQTDEIYPIAELQKAETLLLLLEKNGIKKVDVIAHSEGAINLAIAATIRPQLFHNFILVTPAGISGKDSSARLILGFLQHAMHTRLIFPKKAKNTENQFLKRIRMIKGLSSIKKEINAMTTYDVYPLLIALRKKGIKIAILAGEKDTALPLERMKYHLEKSMREYSLTQEEKQHFGFDIFATKKGGHELYVNTHEIMQQVLCLLCELEKA